MWKHKGIALLLTLSSISVFSQEPFQNGILLDGNENYVTIPNLDLLDSCRQFTIEFWMKRNNNNPCNLANKWSMTIDGPGAWNQHNQGWSINLLVGEYVFNHLGGITMQPPTIQTYTTYSNPQDGSGGSWRPGWETIGSIPLDSWFHVAVSLDKNKSHQQCIIYINDKVGSGINGYGFELEDLKISTPGCALNLGGFAYNIDSLKYFTGGFDELRIWSTMRNHSQIVSTLYDTLSTAYYASPDSGLIAYLRFDQLENLGVGNEGLADDIRDLSVYTNHAEVVGAAVLTESTIEANQNTNIEISRKIPMSYDMLRNYPNPFNPSTTIRFELQFSQVVRLKVFNTLGVELETLLDGTLPQGAHEVTWNAANRSAGIYFCRLEIGQQSKTIKMLLQN